MCYHWALSHLAPWLTLSQQFVGWLIKLHHWASLLKQIYGSSSPSPLAITLCHNGARFLLLSQSLDEYPKLGGGDIKIMNIPRKAERLYFKTQPSHLYIYGKKYCPRWRGQHLRWWAFYVTQEGRKIPCSTSWDFLRGIWGVFRKWECLYITVMWKHSGKSPGNKSPQAIPHNHLPDALPLKPFMKLSTFEDLAFLNTWEADLDMISLTANT